MLPAISTHDCSQGSARVLELTSSICPCKQSRNMTFWMEIALIHQTIGKYGKYWWSAFCCYDDPDFINAKLKRLHWLKCRKFLPFVSLLHFRNTILDSSFCVSCDTQAIQSLGTHRPSRTRQVLTPPSAFCSPPPVFMGVDVNDSDSAVEPFIHKATLWACVSTQTIFV